MAEVSLSINDRQYSVACDDGQEAHLRTLAAHIDEHVRDLVTSIGQVGEPRLLVMASLLVADELADAYARIATLEDGQGVAAAPVSQASGADVVAAEAMTNCASRLEAIAARLEGA